MKEHPHTHQDLVRRAAKWLRSTRRCRLVITEIGAPWVAGISPDAMGWKSNGWSILVECKSSRRDFLRDRSKSHRRLGLETPGCERWYLCPKGIVAKDDLPPGWGLLDLSPGGQLRQVVGCPLQLSGSPTVRVLADSEPGRSMTVERWRLEAPLLIAAAAVLGKHDACEKLQDQVDGLRKKVRQLQYPKMRQVGGRRG